MNYGVSVRLAVSLRFTSGALHPNFAPGRSVRYHVLLLVGWLELSDLVRIRFVVGPFLYLFRGVRCERLYAGLLVARSVTFRYYATVPLHIPYSVLV